MVCPPLSPPPPVPYMGLGVACIHSCAFRRPWHCLWKDLCAALEARLSQKRGTYIAPASSFSTPLVVVVSWRALSRWNCMILIAWEHGLVAFQKASQNCLVVPNGRWKPSRNRKMIQKGPPTVVVDHPQNGQMIEKCVKFIPAV